MFKISFVDERDFFYYYFSYLIGSVKKQCALIDPQFLPWLLSLFNALLIWLCGSFLTL